MSDEALAGVAALGALVRDAEADVIRLRERLVLARERALALKENLAAARAQYAAFTQGYRQAGRDALEAMEAAAAAGDKA